jgi:hypothetical protein
VFATKTCGKSISQRQRQRQQRRTTPTATITRMMENECCICLEAYHEGDDDQQQHADDLAAAAASLTTTAISSSPTCRLKSPLASHACSHGICVQCAITHIVAYEREFCPYCRIENAFSEPRLVARLAVLLPVTSASRREERDRADALLRTAKFTAVKEKIAVPWIYDTMTTLLNGDAYTDDDLPSAKLTASLHVATTSVDRRANGSIHAEFCLSLIDDDTVGSSLGETEEDPAGGPMLGGASSSSSQTGMHSGEREHANPSCRLVLECTIQPMPSEPDDTFLEDNEVVA